MGHLAFAAGRTTPLGWSRAGRDEPAWRQPEPQRWPLGLALLGIGVVSAGLWFGIFRLAAALF